MGLEKLTKELFLEILEVLDEKLIENKLELSLNIYGGTVMMACFDARPATKDIDAIFETSLQIDNILMGIAETYGLSPDWINQDIKEPLKQIKKENLKEMYRFRNLKVYAPSAEQMLAMKILSARPEPYKDFADAELLIKHLGMETLEQILSVFDNYIGRRYLGDRQKMFLNYVGKDLNKSLERIFNIIKADDFNLALTNLLIDLYSSDYEKYFEELYFDESQIDNLNKDGIERLTKIAAVIEYVGNRQPHAKLYDWIYSNQLKLDEPYTPGVEKETFARVRRIISAPKEFALRNVFYEEKTIKPL